jgi:NTE family protein
MKAKKLPGNWTEVCHRARDIMLSDKSQHNIKLSKAITRYLKYIAELYQIIEKNIELAKIDKKQYEMIRRTFTKMKDKGGAEIKSIFRITRDEPSPPLASPPHPVH